MATRSAQAMPTHRYASNSRLGGTRYSAGTRYYGGSRYYGGNRFTAAIAIIIAADSATHLTAIRTGRIHTMGTRIRTRTYEGYPYAYSYYSEPAYGYASLVAQVQRRLGELGYYRGVIDGIMGPRTRAAISAYEDTHNLVVDGTISPRLLARMGLA